MKRGSASVEREFRQKKWETKRLKGSGSVRGWTWGRRSFCEGDKKRGENGGQRDENNWELEVVVGWGRCPRCIQDRLVAAGHSISPYSAWQIHRHSVKMKSFESNLQDNRLPLYPEMDQCWTRQARRKTFSFFICWRWGHLCLTSSIAEDECRAAQSKGFSLCLYNITASLHFILYLYSTLPLYDA